MVDYCQCKVKRVSYNGMQHKYECLECEKEMSAVGMLSVGNPVEKCEHNIPTSQACDSCYWNEAIEAAHALLAEACGKVDPKLVPYEVTNAMHKIKGLKK